MNPMTPEQNFLHTAQSAGIPAGLAELAVRAVQSARVWLKAQARHTQPAPALMQEGMKDWCDRVMKASSEDECRRALDDFSGSLLEGHPEPRAVPTDEKRRLAIRCNGVGFSREQIIGLLSGTAAHNSDWPPISWEVLQQAATLSLREPWIRASFPAWNHTDFTARSQAQGLSPEEAWVMATTRADLARSGLWPSEALLDCAQAVNGVAAIDGLTTSQTFQTWLRQQSDAVRNNYQDAVEVGMSWQDVTDSLARPIHSPLDLPVAASASSTPEEAWQNLERAAGQAGLNGIDWHMNEGATPEVLDLYAAEITAVNDSLASTVGWEGGVLGLGGLVRLHMDDPTLIGGGEQSQDAYGLTIAANANGGGWRVMAHEWLHALDEAIAQHWYATSVWHASDAPSELPHGLHHSMVALLDGMSQGSFSRAAHEGMLQAVEARFVSRWEDVAPHTIAWLQTQPRDAAFGQSVKAWGERLQELDPSITNLHRAALSLEAHMIGHQDLPSDSRLMWRHFSDRWKEHCSTTWKTTLADMADYFERPTEMLAYAFECISEGPGFCGANPRSLYERTAEETHINTPAFQAFFRVLSEHWSSIQPVPSLPTQVGERLRERRNTSFAAESLESVPAPEPVPMGERLRVRRGTSTASCPVVEPVVEREAARLRR